ncbi:hypothetical protein RS3R6_02980 [Pseudomonas atacamensis]|uniref:Bacterial Ig-like domain-containing protein n=1 Tax=Pseudomonas atacamensis TaxID=2565368 RepID=A0ABQ5PCY8_9PSED|nr:Ig-like domain-containing protein [Pseudomonas atacamensis]GLH41388.1 hypothetical protein RS3R1_04750 [Pseudomonas atacamensis]GLH52117.1 hypothetical protein RS3R6_02980 [Pseudomonas atacamensis]
MNASVVNVAVVDGKTITQTVELSSVKNGQPVRIKAVQGGKYILAEGANGVAPENITIKRVGKDLHIALEGSDPDQPQLIIEDFEGSGGQLVGVAEDGSYHEYISSDAEQDRSAAFLIEGVETPQVLGAQPLTGFGDGLAAAAGIGWFWPALLGLAAVGVLGGVYAASRDDDNDDGKGVGTGNTDKGSIGGADDNVGDKQGLIKNGGSTDDRTPTFTGEGRPGTSVEIIDNGKAIGTAIVGEDGKWEYTPPEPGLDDGKHEIVIVPIDEDGDKGEPSPGYEIIVDTVAPSRPLIDGIYDDVAPKEGQIGSGGRTNDATPTLSGTGEPNAIIHIYDNGVEIGSVIVNGDGKWSFTPDPALSEGSHEFTVTAEDAAGNISTPSLPFPIIVDLTMPGKPGVGTGGIEDVQDNVGPIQGSIGDGGTTDDSTPTIVGGGAEPGDTVTIIDNGVEIGTALVGADGKWEFTPNPALTDGSHQIVVVITDPAGNESEPSAPWTIEIDTSAPFAAAVVDSMGKDSGADSNDFVTNDGSAGRLIQGSLTAALGAGEKVQVSTDGGATWLDALMNAGGTWSFLDQSSHTSNWIIQTRVVDAVGNSNVSNQSVTMDTDAPDEPLSVTRNGNTVTVVFDGAGVEVGDVVNVVVGNDRIDVTLTAADIANGSVDVTTTASSTEAHAASIVDKVGNVSGFVNDSSGTTQLVDFTGILPQLITTPLDVGVFTVETTSGTSQIRNSIAGESDPSGGTPTGSFLQINVSGPASSALLDLKGNTATGVAFNLYATDFAGNTVVFYDAAGVEVHREALSAGGPNGNNTGGGYFDIDMPAGVTFSSMEFFAVGNDGWLVDNIEFSNYSSPLFDPVNQVIEGASGVYHGGDEENTFSLADVTDLDSVNTGINAGSGLDTLRITGAGQVFDLTALSNKIDSVEIIDITGTGNNTLNLSLSDVLEQGETSLFTADETMQMMIKGNAGDVVNLDDMLPDGTDPGDWATAGTATVAGVTYNVFQHSTLDAQLLIQDGVTANLV